MFLDISNVILEGIFATEPQAKSFQRKYLCEFHGHTVQFTKNQITLFLKSRNGIGNTLVYFKIFREKIKQLTEQLLDGEKVTHLSFRVKNYHLSITWRRKSRLALKLLVRELDQRQIHVKKVCIGEESSSAGAQVDYQTIQQLAAGTQVRSFHFVQFIIDDPEFPHRKPSLKLIPGKVTSGNAASTNFTFIATAFSQTIEQVVDILENDDINGINEYVEQFTNDAENEHSSLHDEGSSVKSVESTGFNLRDNAETFLPAENVSAAAAAAVSNGASSFPASFPSGSHFASISVPTAAASPPSSRELLQRTGISAHSTSRARAAANDNSGRKRVKGNASSRASKRTKFKSGSAELVGETELLEHQGTEFLQSLSDSSDEDTVTSNSKLSLSPDPRKHHTAPGTTREPEPSISSAADPSLNALSVIDDDNPFFNGTMFDGLW